jgi:hypothetical protein
MLATDRIARVGSKVPNDKDMTLELYYPLIIEFIHLIQSSAWTSPAIININDSLCLLEDYHLIVEMRFCAPMTLEAMLEEA